MGLEAAPTLFLDRDGIINVDRGYVFEWENFEWVEGIEKLIVEAKSAGYRVIVVTNQSGIGRGYYTEDDFLNLTHKMLDKIPVDAVVYCPHSPEESCPGRKPGTLMLDLVAEVFPVEKKKSWLIGDKDSDMEAASRFGIASAQFHSGDVYKFAKENITLS